MKQINAVFGAAALALASPAFAVDAPSLLGNTLTIPRVDSSAQVGKYQGGVFELQVDGSWRLNGVETLGTPRIGKAPVSTVEVVKSGTLPVAVYLRASGVQSSCGFDGAARVHQRLTGTHFEVAISARHTDSATAELTNGYIVCTADIRPFKMTVPLDVYGLDAGTYTYDVNGVTGSFTLDSANKYADDCDAAEQAERHCL